MRCQIALVAFVLAGCGQPASQPPAEAPKALPGPSTAPWIRTMIPNGRQSGILIHKEINDAWVNCYKHGGNEFILQEAREKYTKTLQNLRGTKVDFPFVVSYVGMRNISISTFPVDPDYQKKLIDIAQREFRGEQTEYLPPLIVLRFDFSGIDHGDLHYQYKGKFEEIPGEISTSYFTDQDLRKMKGGSIISVLGTISSATTVSPNQYSGPKVDPLISIKIESVRITRY